MFETNNEIEARQHILAREQKRKEIIVPVPELGMDVLIQALSGTMRGVYYAFVRDVAQEHPDTDGEYFKRIWFEQVRLGVVHPKTKKPIFQPADRDAFMDGDDGLMIEMLAVMVREISGISISATEEAKKKLQMIQNATVTTS